MAVVAVFFVACENPSPNAGYSLASDGTNLLLYYKPCHDDARIYSIEVGTRTLDEDDLTPLWKVSSTEGTIQRLFVFGRTPEGFQEDLPVEESVLDAAEIRATFRTDELDEDHAYAEPSKLRVGKVLVDGSYLSAQKFAGANTCG